MVHEIVAQARDMGILCQGRGSAANSAVCYCLRITEVDPDKNDVLFERFLSNKRDEPPDIDFEQKPPFTTVPPATRLQVHWTPILTSRPPPLCHQFC